MFAQIWEEKEIPKVLVKAMQKLCLSYPSLQFGTTLDEVSAWYGIEEMQQIGNYKLLRYRVPCFQWSTTSNGSVAKIPSYCRGLNVQVSAVFGGLSSRLIAYQFDFLMCQVAQAGSKLEWRKISEDDLRGIMHWITPSPKVAQNRFNLVKSKQKKMDVVLGDKIQRVGGGIRPAT